MSDIAADPPRAQRDHCSYPGCTRPRRPDPATGRPSRYCEQPDVHGGPVHNRATAFRARRAGVAVQEDSAVSAPVSMARATLDQRLAELPSRVEELRQYFDDVVADIRAAGDLEAAGAEVEDAHRDALSRITEAERRAAAADRAARLAEERAQQAERDREEADQLAEEAAGEAARVREQAEAETAAVRAEADAAVARAQQQLAEALAEYHDRLAQRDTEVEQAQQEAAAARLEAAAAISAQRAADDAALREREAAAELRRTLDQARHEADQMRRQLQADLDSARSATQQAIAETAAVRVDLATTQAEADAARRALEADRAAIATLTRDLERQRDDARAEREALHQTHAQQLAQAQRNADDRVQALTDALAVATAAAETYRAQLQPAAGKRSTPRKSTPSS